MTVGSVVFRPNRRFERDASPASFACRLRAPQAKRYTFRIFPLRNSLFVTTIY